jgi:hypothetical protein
VANLGWIGVGGDVLLRLLPATLIGQLPVLGLIVALMAILFARNANHLDESALTPFRLVFFGALLSIGLHAILAKTGTVFLYFNF